MTIFSVASVPEGESPEDWPPDHIVKETNPGNKNITDMLGLTDPKDPKKLYESERIKKSVSDFEQSLWEY